jgi:hypothetical protein
MIEVSSYFIHADSKISICVAMVILTSFGIPVEDSAIKKSWFALLSDCATVRNAKRTIMLDLQKFVTD